MPDCKIIAGDCRDILPTLPEKSVHACITSPPYFKLRDYGVDAQIGNESLLSHYIAELVDVFRKVRRVLRTDGTLWLNLGDCYGEGKNLLGVPWRVAFALKDDGWHLRSDIIWHKPNPMPESVTDRPTKSHEYLFLLTKNESYHYDAEAIKEPATSIEEHLKRKRIVQSHGDSEDSTKGMNGGHNSLSMSETRNKRSVWTIRTAPSNWNHFAAYPPELIKPCILAGCPAGGTVIDPFGGTGTTGEVALSLGRSAILIEINPDYAEVCRQRTNTTIGFGF